MKEVTFKDFARLAADRGWTVEMLAERFHDKIERPADFFERVLSCKWRNPTTGRPEDRSGVVIPYRSVLQFYFTELEHRREASGEKSLMSEARRRHQVAAGRASAAKRRRNGQIASTLATGEPGCD